MGKQQRVLRGSGSMYRGPGVARMWRDPEAGADRVAGGQKDTWWVETGRVVRGQVQAGPCKPSQGFGGLLLRAIGNHQNVSFCLVLFLFLLIVTKFHLPFGKVILALVAGTNQRESVACRKHYLLFFYLAIS